MPHCTHHPGRISVAALYGQNYCAPCRDGIVAARLRVDRHVQPRDCFVWYQAANDWEPITGTGCGWPTDGGGAWLTSFSAENEISTEATPLPGTRMTRQVTMMRKL